MEIKKLICMNMKCSPNRGTAFQMTIEDYDRLTREPWLKALVERIRKGDGEAKAKLPFRCPHYTSFVDNHRQQRSIIPEAFTWQTCIDIDEAEMVDKAIGEARRIDGEEGMWKGMLLHMDYSARKKLHIDVRMPVGMTIEETQRAYCEALGVPFDESCVTPERFIYITPADSEIYRSDEWCRQLSDEEVKARREAFAKRGLTIDGRRDGNTKSLREKVKDDCPMVRVNETTDEPSARALYVFDLCMQKAGLTAETFSHEGTRHNGLKMMLPDLGQMLSQDELRAVLAQRMPEFYREKDCQQLVSDFYEKYIDTSKPMTLAQKEIFRQSTHAADKTTIKQLLGDTPPEMPKRLPRLIQLLISKEPKIYQPTVANAVFPSLGAHFLGVQFPYVDNTLHEATFMCCTIAPMSSGKSCVDRPVERILKDIRQRDQLSIDRENEWKQQCRTRGANKEKPRRPEGLGIQILPSDLTHAAFVQKLVDADGRFLFMIVDEVELFYQLKTSGTKSIGKIFRLAFDCKPYGQMRVGVDSVSGTMPLRLNWNASTTIQRGKQFFKTMKADGTLSRINFTTILTERGRDIPIHGIYDEAFDEALKPYIDRLNAASGTIDCPKAHQLVKRMLKACLEIADPADDELYERLSYRAVVIAWLKAMTLYVAEGKWDKSIEDFAMWSLNYDMWCKMQFFGDEMREQMEGEVIQMRRGPRNLLGQLPDEFTINDAEMVRERNGRERKAQSMLTTWKCRGYVTYNPSTGRYVKTAKWRGQNS